MLTLPTENVYLKSSIFSAEQPCYAKPVVPVAQGTTVVLAEKLEALPPAGPYQSAYELKPTIQKEDATISFDYFHSVLKLYHCGFMGNQLSKLHMALRDQATPEEVKVMLRDNANKTFLSTPNECGNLPLHCALYYGASYAVIEVLIKAYPQALEEHNDNEDLPLHLALYINAPPEVIKMIFEEYQEATAIQNKYGDLPLHYAVLHSNPSVAIVKIVLDKFPSALSIKNDNGWLPLHFACRYVADSKVIKMIFEQYKGAAQIPNNNGDLALHYACYNTKATFNIRKMLVDEYHESITRKNKDGKIPFHYAEAGGTVTKMMCTLISPTSSWD